MNDNCLEDNICCYWYRFFCLMGMSYMITDFLKSAFRHHLD